MNENVAQTLYFTKSFFFLLLIRVVSYYKLVVKLAEYRKLVVNVSPGSLSLFCLFDMLDGF